MLNLVAALLPAFCLLIYFIKKDAYPEPMSRLLQTFLLGCLTIAPFYFLSDQLIGLIGPIDDPFSWAARLAFLLAAIPEELLKWTVVWFFCARLSDFDEPMDGYVYGATASLGFAALENILYVSQGGMELAIARAITAVPAHACFGAIMGHYIAKAVLTDPNRRGRHLTLSLCLPIGLHGLYNLGPLYNQALIATTPNPMVSMPIWPSLLFWTVLIGMTIAVKRMLKSASKDQLTHQGMH